MSKTQNPPKETGVQTSSPAVETQKKVLKGVGEPLPWEPKEIHSVAEFIRAGFLKGTSKKDLRSAIRSRFPEYKPVDRAIFKYYHDLLDKNLIQPR